MIDRDAPLAVVRQCGLLGISRSSLYYREKAVSEVELAIDIDPFLQRRS